MLLLTLALAVSASARSTPRPAAPPALDPRGGPGWRGDERRRCAPTGLVKTYQDGVRRVEVLKGIDLAVEPGEMVAIVGPSGSGKSTLLHLLGALDRPDAGTVEIGGQRSGEAVGGGAGRVPQPHHRLRLPVPPAAARLHGPGERHAARPDRRDASRARCYEHARGLLREVGLEDRLDHFPNQLSGGERQRVALCRALALEPPLLLADEPTGNLDPASGEHVFELLLELQARHRTTGVLVTHNPEIAGRCSRVAGAGGRGAAGATAPADTGLTRTTRT